MREGAGCIGRGGDCAIDGRWTGIMTASKVRAGPIGLIPLGWVASVLCVARFLSFRGGSLGSLAACSLRLQDAQTKTNSSFSASSGEMLWHLLCCHWSHFSH